MYINISIFVLFPYTHIYTSIHVNTFQITVDKQHYACSVTFYVVICDWFCCGAIGFISSPSDHSVSCLALRCLYLL